MIEFMADDQLVFDKAKAWCERNGDTIEKTESCRGVLVASVMVSNRWSSFRDRISYIRKHSTPMAIQVRAE